MSKDNVSRHEGIKLLIGESERIRGIYMNCDIATLSELESLRQQLAESQAREAKAALSHENLIEAIRDAKRTARLLHTEDGHEVVCIEPQCWNAISRASK